MTTIPEFHALDLQHLVTLGIIAAICAGLFRAARAGRLPEWAGRLIGVALLGYAVTLYVQQWLGNSLSWQNSLPLELCNIVLIACIVSLFWRNQFATEICYFWGLGGVLQATITPDLSRGFPSWDFLFFFWGHGATLIAIFFLISRPGYRPRGKSILRMMLSLNGYGLVVGTIDALTGWNYGYLCRKPYEPSLFDYLGRWPWYLLSLEAIAFLTFLILDLPWRFSGSLRKEKALTKGG